MEFNPVTAAARLGFVGWEEVVVSNEKGRRVVHYCLKSKDFGGGGGDGLDLVVVVVGKEKSLRHMVYQFVNQVGIVLDLCGHGSSAALPRLKTRRDVIDWFNSIFPDSSFLVSSRANGYESSGKEPSRSDEDPLKDSLIMKLDHSVKDFLWLGSSWTCKKKRKHYQSLYHNGVKISVNDFVYVLGEEYKRLVAYLDDMYEDSRGNNMVVVRWFHKVDEVDTNLPHNYNDREIFFSLCLQDLSVECIDGLACVLSPEHFKKFRQLAKRSRWDPFFCCRKYDNYEFKPFDITQLKGYWNQEILRSMYSVPLPDDSPLHDGCLKLEDPSTCGVVNTSRKRIRLSKGSKKDPQIVPARDSGNGMSSVCNLSRERIFVERLPPHLAVGQLVEVLSQDSGIRGCWFRASIIKKHKDKIKVRYQDLRDADDETSSLEEWVPASRVAVQDVLGLRINGRTTVRPATALQDGKVSWVIDVGAVVDAWWHDGWWEGIVIEKECREKIRVYFPGEKLEAVFSPGDVRHSQEWLGGVWNYFKGRPDLASSVLASIETKSDLVHQAQGSVCNKQQVLAADALNDSLSEKEGDCWRKSHLVFAKEKITFPDLLKDDSLWQLRWKTTRKRKRVVAEVQMLKCNINNVKRRIIEKRDSERDSVNFSVPSDDLHLNSDNDKFKPFKVDRENCKYIGDAHFNSSVAPRLTSLVCFSDLLDELRYLTFPNQQQAGN
ncbi:hypothetical protein Droror1_Dr00022392 [Drosera rotundifolia]